MQGTVALNKNWYIIAISCMFIWDHIGVEVKNKELLRNWNGNIQAKTKPEDNLDQSKVCWQSSKLNEKHLAYKKH